MLTIILITLLILFAAKLFAVAIAAAWGILKVIVGVLLLPLVCIVALIEGLLYIAIPLLAIIGLAALLGKGRAGAAG